MIFEIENKYAADVKWSEDADGIEHYKDAYLKMQADEDKTYGEIQRYLTEVFPDFKWKTECSLRRFETTFMEVRFCGRYKSLNCNIYSGNGLFEIIISLTREIDRFYDNQRKPVTCDHYRVHYMFERNGKRLPNVTNKLKTPTDGDNYRFLCHTAMDGDRCFKTCFRLDENGNEVIEVNQNLIAWVKELCTYRSNLVTKYVDADKAERCMYNQNQTSFDIDTMEYPTKMDEIVNKYGFNAVVDMENDTVSRTYYVVIGESRIGITAWGNNARLYFKETPISMASTRRGDIGEYIIRIAHAAILDTSTVFKIDDPKVFEAFDMLCQVCRNIWNAYSEFEKKYKSL